MEKLLNDFFEAVKKDKKEFHNLKHSAVKLRQYEFALQLRNMEKELFPNIKLKQDVLWISVNERLPNDLSYYLASWEEVKVNEDGTVMKTEVTNTGVTLAMCAIYTDKKWYNNSPINGMTEINGITHWMPFPNPPKT